MMRLNGQKTTLNVYQTMKNKYTIKKKLTPSKIEKIKQDFKNYWKKYDNKTNNK